MTKSEVTPEVRARVVASLSAELRRDSGNPGIETAVRAAEEEAFNTSLSTVRARILWLMVRLVPRASLNS